MTTTIYIPRDASALSRGADKVARAIADEAARPGLGNFIIMDHIMRARAAGLPYVYLGYWVKGSARMAYKTRYRPLEVLGPNGWSLLADENASYSPPVHPVEQALALSGELA